MKMRAFEGLAKKCFSVLNAIENASVESFNGKFRDKCLNELWFLNLVDAKTAIEAWRIHYNAVRPHSSLGGRTPRQFASVSEGSRRLCRLACKKNQKLRL